MWPTQRALLVTIWLILYFYFYLAFGYKHSLSHLTVLLCCTSCPIYFCVWRVPSARPLIPFSSRPLFVCKFSRQAEAIFTKEFFTPMFFLLCLMPYSCLCAGHPSTVTTWGRWEWWRRSWRITSCSIPHPHTRQVLRSGRRMYKDDNWYRIQQLCTQITSTSNFCKRWNN